MTWAFSDDPTDPCIYCVQWRAVDTSDEFIENYGEQEPYWPDGSIVPLVWDGICDRCTQSLASMREECK